MIALALLILINLWILQTTREPQVLVEVKQRYTTEADGVEILTVTLQDCIELFQGFDPFILSHQSGKWLLLEVNDIFHFGELLPFFSNSSIKGNVFNLR